MSETDLQYELMMEGRMNLMHLPPGAIAWLWDRPQKQVQAAEDLAVAANAHGNPVVDSSLLKADQNVLLIKCEGGECFRVYPDGGYSFEETPMDMGGCSSILQGSESGDCGCPMDDMGHAEEMMDDLGNAEHLDRNPPESGVAVPQGMTNIAGEPTMDEDQGGDWGGPGASTMGGMGTGTPYVGDIDMSSYDNEDIDPVGFSRECRGYDDDELAEMAKAVGVEGCLIEMTRQEMMDKYGDDRESAPTPPDHANLEVYDAATDQMKDVLIKLGWDIQPTEYEGQYVFYQGGAVLDNMGLAQPVEVNGEVFTKLSEKLAALILQDLMDFEPGQAWETLRNYVEESEGKDIDVPVMRYPDSRGL